MRANGIALAALVWSGCYIEIRNGKFDTGDSGLPQDGVAPTCAITAPADGALLLAGQPVSLEGTAEDGATPAESLVAVWSSSLVGELGVVNPDDAGAIVFETSALQAGTHVLALEVLDASGNACVAERTVVVEGAPAVAILAPVGGAVVDAGEIAFLGQVGDVEDAADALRLVWTDDVVGELNTAAAGVDGTASFSTAALAYGPHTVTLTATDSSGAVGLASVSFTVNGLPTAPVVSISPADPTTVDALTAQIVTPGVDPEGAAVSYLYAWSVDGAPSAASTTEVLPADATTRGEVWSVTVTPTDGISLGAPAVAEVTIGNSPPSIALAVSPDGVALPVLTDALLTATATASDADGDAVSLTYLWTVDGVPVAESGPTLNGVDWFDKGQLVSLRVTASDGLAQTEAVWAATVANAPPRAGLVAVSPAQPTDADDLFCEITLDATDPDGDILSYEMDWDVNGIVFALADTVVWPGDQVQGLWTTPGELWTCAVKPFDGEAFGPVRTSTVFVGP